MTDVKNKKCIECKKKQPSYGEIGLKNATHCSGCYNKLDDDIKQNMEDVKNPKCSICNKIQPIYGIIGTKNATHCLKCFNELDNDIKQNMTNVISKKCIECKETQPTYGIIGTKKPLYCLKCVNELNDDIKQNMTDVRHPKCVSSMCDTYSSNPKYKGYCFRCFVYNFPNEQNSRNYKTKEKTVVDYITETFKNYKIINDKVISGGCSKRRPDIFIDILTHCIIIEIDEDEHTNYNCENKRIMEISQDLGHPNIVFIRFNPDAYTDNDGKKIKSCWKVNKNGICIIDSKNKWNDRLDTLKKEIEYWLNNIPDKHITVKKLYYSNYE